MALAIILYFQIGYGALVRVVLVVNFIPVSYASLDRIRHRVKYRRSQATVFGSAAYYSEPTLCARVFTYRFDLYLAGWLVGTVPEINLAADRADSEGSIGYGQPRSGYEPVEYTTDPETGGDYLRESAYTVPR